MLHPSKLHDSNGGHNVTGAVTPQHLPVASVFCGRHHGCYNAVSEALFAWEAFAFRDCPAAVLATQLHSIPSGFSLLQQFWQCSTWLVLNNDHWNLPSRVTEVCGHCCCGEGLLNLGSSYQLTEQAAPHWLSCASVCQALHADWVCQCLVQPADGQLPLGRRKEHTTLMPLGPQGAFNRLLAQLPSCNNGALQWGIWQTPTFDSHSTNASLDNNHHGARSSDKLHYHIMQQRARKIETCQQAAAATT